MQTDGMHAAAEFSAYGVSHLAVLALVIVAAWWMVRRGRALRETPAADRLSTTFAVVILIPTLPLQIWFQLPERFQLGVSIPIQLCDLAWLAAVYALLTYRPWAVALTYYWGLTLSIQPALTPDLDAGFPDPAFILYWAMHGLTIVAAIYLVWGLGFRLDWRSYRIAVAMTALWAGCVFTFNSIADVNYGFLNAKPDDASILDVFGPWPWYLLVETVLIVTVWALMTWPWVSRSRSSYHRASQESGPWPRRR